MQPVQIVTDSCADFTNPHFLSQHPVTLVPNKITVGGKTYREGVDLNAEDALRLFARLPQPPVVQPPTEAEYLDVYTRLARETPTIISIHVSREISTSWRLARRAAQQLAGNCRIIVIDSQTLSAGQAMLVRVAAQALETQETVEDIVRVVRGAVERIFTVLYTESLDYLLRSHIMGPSHTILGAMLGVKPVLSMEDGRLMPMEKVRTRVQAIERLVEYAVEFSDVEDAVILQHKPFMSEQTRMLQERLAVDFPGRHFPYAMYGPSLAALVGTDATGLVVLETEPEKDTDDFL